MIKKLFLLLLMAVPSLVASAEDLHINARTGNDANPGTLAQPLKTIAEAARRINLNYKKEAATVFIADGVYPLTETVLFNNNKFTLQYRLIIRAEIMPDDPNWNAQQMPIIVPMIPTVPTPGNGEEAKGLQMDVSHATVAGLKFTSSPLYYYIDEKQNRRYYPIWREGKTLDDLLITQCTFVGNADLMPIRVAVLANGHGLVLDHCVFFNCQNSVVFCDAEGGKSHHNAMRYCLVYGSGYSGVWTTGNTDDDFEFHHNIIANSRTAWIRDKSEHHYAAHNSIFSDNIRIAAFGDDSGAVNVATGIDFLKTDAVQFKGSIEIEKDQSKNNYLQLKEGSYGSELKSGLFKK